MFESSTSCEPHLYGLFFFCFSRFAAATIGRPQEKRLFLGPVVYEMGVYFATDSPFPHVAVPWAARGYQRSLVPAYLQDRIRKKAFISLPEQIYGLSLSGKYSPHLQMAASFFSAQTTSFRRANSPSSLTGRMWSKRSSSRSISSLKRREKRQEKKYWRNT